MADFSFRWREPGFDGRNAAQETGAATGAGFNAFNRSAEATGTNTFQNTSELDTEIEQIRRKIAALEIEREQLEKSRVSRDELDRKLAANRARVSDFGTARAHWSDIDTRKQIAENWERQERLRATDEARASKNTIENLRGEIDKQNTLLQWGTENRAFAADLQTYNRLVEKLRSEYGVTYDPYNAGKSQGTPGATGTPMTDEGWKIFETQFKDKNGNWISEEWKNFYLENRPQNTVEAAESAKRVKGEKTADEAAKASADERAKESAAIDEVMATRGLRAAGKTFTAKNGKKVAVELLADGVTVRYKSGKTSKDRRF